MVIQVVLKPRSWSTSISKVLSKLPSVQRLPLPALLHDLRPDPEFRPALRRRVPHRMRYHTVMLMGRILLLRPAWRWLPLTYRPWISTSITEFWSFRWHQIFRHIYVAFSSRPRGTLLGAFAALSRVMHDLGMWGLGQGTEFRAVAGFFPPWELVLH
jgi:hypothetical protein